MEVLIAWAKKRCNEDPYFKVVIMSATIDTAPLATFFSTQAVISVPGRSFPVKRRHGNDVLSEITTKLQGPPSNMLVFLPGKAEIQEVAEALTKKTQAAGIPVIPLHSQLEATAQQLAFSRSPTGKIILATNIAQTSITIDDIDVVIDSGLERRSEVRSGVEGLFVAQVSQADCLQRAGRAGRTKPGEYILAPYGHLPCEPFEKRPAYGTPEILRKHIDRLTLRLANVGIDIETLDFYHDPSNKAIQRAKHTLLTLGAMRADGSVTPAGKAMERYPVESSYARMLVEAQDYSNTIQSTLAAIIAIQEVGGIVKGGARYTGWQRYTRLAQYDVYLALPTILPDEQEELGIITKNVGKAREVMQRLNRDLQGIELNDELLAPISGADESNLLRCIVAGMIDQLWSIDEYGVATHITTKKVRELSSSTVVRHAPLVAGFPFDLQVPMRDGNLQTLHLVQDITRINTDWLVDLAPEQFSGKTGKVAFDPRSGMLVLRQQVRSGKHTFEGTGLPVTDNNMRNQKLFQETFSKWAYECLERERRSLVGSRSRHIPEIPLPHVQSKVRAMAGGIISLDTLPKHQRVQLLQLAKLATYVGDEYVNQLTALKQKGHAKGRHNAHRGWKPAHKRGGVAKNRRGRR